MRSQTARWQRSQAARWLAFGVVTVSLSLNMAFVMRDVFHSPFAEGLIIGLASCSLPLLSRFLQGPDRRQNTTE